MTSTRQDTNPQEPVKSWEENKRIVFQEASESQRDTVSTLLLFSETFCAFLERG